MITQYASGVKALLAIFLSTASITVSAHAEITGHGRPDTQIPAPTIQFDGGRVNEDSSTECLGSTALDANGEIMIDEEKNAHISRFLHQASFGPSLEMIDDVRGQGICNWLVDQYTRSSNRSSDQVPYEDTQYAGVEPENFVNLFWVRAGTSEDQLRERVAYALSQILVVSGKNARLSERRVALKYYANILAANALGNYRDLLEAVTYSPAMATYLTYLGNQGPSTVAPNRVPDENYAREIMQLFTVGLVELHHDGTLKLENKNLENEKPIQLYTNADVQELAKVFTGLKLGPGSFNINNPLSDTNPTTQFGAERRLVMDDAFHVGGVKTVLGISIAGNNGDQDIAQALDLLVEHPNTPPFIARQLIQRLVSSRPTPSYVKYVADAFVDGKYTLPDGQTVGTDRRGDLMATVSAVLMHPHARDIHTAAHDAHRGFTGSVPGPVHRGKYREPVLRLLNVARAFGVTNYEITNSIENPNEPGDMIDVIQPEFISLENNIGQIPYFAPSVFNFYRPGYIPNSDTVVGAARSTAPEAQIMTENTVFAIIDEIDALMQNDNGHASFDFDFVSSVPSSVMGDDDALIDHVSLLLTGATLNFSAHARIRDVLRVMPDNATEDQRIRVAVYLVIASTEAVVQTNGVPIQ